MNISDIERTLEASTGPSTVLEAARILLAAMNDWPTDLRSTEDLLQALRSTVGELLDKASIQARLSTVDYVNEAWMAESLVGLLEIFSFFPKGTSLVEILGLIEADLSAR